MAFKKKTEETNGIRAQSWISTNHYGKLENFSKMYKLPISRLIAIAIERELEKDTPFKVDFTLPTDLLPNAYADEAGKILKFMRRLKSGVALDFLYVLRHDIGIFDGKAFLAGFSECIKANKLETFDAPDTSKYAKGTILYRIRDRKLKKEIDKEIVEYNQFLKLKKKYDNV